MANRLRLILLFFFYEMQIKIVFFCLFIKLFHIQKISLRFWCQNVATLHIATVLFFFFQTFGRHSKQALQIDGLPLWFLKKKLNAFRIGFIGNTPSHFLIASTFYFMVHIACNYKTKCERVTRSIFWSLKFKAIFDFNGKTHITFLCVVECWTATKFDCFECT